MLCDALSWLLEHFWLLKSNVFGEAFPASDGTALATRLLSHGNHGYNLQWEKMDKQGVFRLKQAWMSWLSCASTFWRKKSVKNRWSNLWRNMMMNCAFDSMYLACWLFLYARIFTTLLTSYYIYIHIFFKCRITNYVVSNMFWQSHRIHGSCQKSTKATAECEGRDVLKFVSGILGYCMD